MKFLHQLKTWLSTNKTAVLFVAKMLVIYLALQGVYDYILSPYTAIDSKLIHSIIASSEDILKALGYEVIESSNSIYQYHFGIQGTSGVVIGNSCDGLSLFILFTAFLLVFRGKWWFKILFTILGILLIHLLNVIRVVALALIVKSYPESLDFHHSYTFTLFVYGCIFLLWMFRIKIYQQKKW